MEIRMKEKWKSKSNEKRNEIEMIIGISKERG